MNFLGFFKEEMISMIFAMDENYGIGKNNSLCWYLKEDLKYFSNKTKGKTVIMGRNTWNSLPEKFRPLPGRENVIISSTMQSTNDYKVFHSLKEAINSLTGDIFLIGGKRIYQEGILYADKIYITKVYGKFDCNIFFDKEFIKKIQEKFKLLSCSGKKEENGIKFEFLEYVKV